MAFRVKASKVFALIKFLFLNFLDVLLFGWHCSTELLDRYISSKFSIKFFGLYFRTCLAMFFNLWTISLSLLTFLSRRRNVSNKFRINMNGLSINMNII